jgi:hypothetical protein
VRFCSLSASRTAAAIEKREPQDYGGPTQDQTGPASLWAPRVVLFALWLVNEYVLRQPMGLLVRSADKYHWPTAVMKFFTFGELDQLCVSPMADVRIDSRRVCATDLALRHAALPAASFRYRALVTRGASAAVALVVARDNDKEECADLGASAVREPLPDNAAERYLTVRLFNGVAPGGAAALPLWPGGEPWSALGRD